jgi:small subunit ribosomal protein S12
LSIQQLLLKFIFIMSTINQCTNSKLFRKKKKNRASLLKERPQFKGVVVRIRIATPKKPNSARRPVCRIMSTKNRYSRVVAHIPGGKHTLRKHSVVLLGGVGARDLPGVNYTCIRGQHDFSGSMTKSRRRSVYGIKLPDALKKKLKRQFRFF